MRFARAALLLAAAGCYEADSGPPAAPPPPPPVVADFLLKDVNPNSASFGLDVSPRDYLGFVSAWYFGHAT